MKSKEKLRVGFTTGSAAAAGAKAALLALSGRKGIKVVDIPLPEAGRLEIPVRKVELNGVVAKAIVIKDGGDDPDVTDRARIITTVSIDPAGEDPGVIIKGGSGVGRVTKPGLPVKVGESAINPFPRIQIKKAVEETLQEVGLTGLVTVTIYVPDGEKIAQRTFNPRLGIVGGISILGTRGIVLPFSNEAYKDTISLGLDMARAVGLETIAFSTGGRSEKFLKRNEPHLPPETFVQVGDFFGFSLKDACQKGFKSVLYACFFGKLVKMAQGYEWTHARDSRIGFDLLARWCAGEGLLKARALEISRANTARQALEIISGHSNRDQIIRSVMERAILSARKFLGPGPQLTYFLFDSYGNLLAKVYSKSQLEGNLR